MMKAGILRYMLIAICIFLTIPKFLETLNYTLSNGGTDLRCRVVAARLLLAGKDPYFYKWNPADGPYLLDPNDLPNRIVNGNVVTPAMLWIVAPLYSLPYPTVRVAWFIFQYLAVIGILILLVWNNTKSSLIPLTITICSMICTANWIYHMERGQIYIVYAFLLTLTWWLYSRQTSRYVFLSGFVGGLFIFLRPFALVLGAAMVLTRNKQWIYGALTGILTGLLLFVAPSPSAWKQYFAAMKTYQHEALHPHPGIANAQQYDIPQNIEGSGNLRNAAVLPVHAISAVYIYAQRNQVTYTVPISIALLGLSFLSLSAFFIWRQKYFEFSVNQIFLLGFLFYMLTEYLVIAPRGAYNTIQWICPLYLMIRSRLDDKKFLFAIIAISVLMQGALLHLDRLSSLSEPLLVIALVYAIFTKEPNRSLWEKPPSIKPTQR